MTVTPEAVAGAAKDERLRVVFDAVQRALEDQTIRHGITPEELGHAITWVTKLAETGELLLAANMLIGIPMQDVTYGRAYASPERDGASPWMALGPAYVAGAPEIDNPGVLPMAPDEPGETLIVSGTVRSTSGEPLGGAVVDLWQTNAEGWYSGISAEQAGPLRIVDHNLPKYHLRGKITTDAEGRYEYRTVVPGLESLTAPGSATAELLHRLGKATSRARHIHANVTHDGHHMLTHQIHFADDPLVNQVAEGAVHREMVLTTELHDDPADYGARGPAAPYRTLTCDYVLRPIGFDEVADPYQLGGFWKV
ncbi:catechol 1,2-dioxygenase [Streptomyces sp. NPDC026672]|uniref:dioxygenase family protein n=1 Tax=unclassified Streptomyces TaxID=2593676 RepID=UPI0033C86E18